jgi:hypothetical protein
MVQPTKETDLNYGDDYEVTVARYRMALEAIITVSSNSGSAVLIAKKALDGKPK